MTSDADRLTTTLAQLNPVMGDVAGNLARARAARIQAASRAATEQLARETADGGPAVLIGTLWVEDGKLHNACALLEGGRIAALRFKVNLPNYGVFDEKRVFARGPVSGPMTLRGVRIGVPICEDIWNHESPEYENIVECLHETGAEILI